jgi:hypothetical protein
MKILSFVAITLGLILAGTAIYMYFINHFALTTTLAIAGSGLFFFSYALTMLLRLSKPYDKSNSSWISGATSYSPTNY